MHVHMSTDDITQRIACKLQLNPCHKTEPNSWIVSVAAALPGGCYASPSSVGITSHLKNAFESTVACVRLAAAAAALAGARVGAGTANGDGRKKIAHGDEG